MERLSLTQAEVNEAANGRVYNTDPNTEQSMLQSAHSEVFHFAAVTGVMLYWFNCFYPLCEATPGMMGKSVWSDHVSGSGEQSAQTFFFLTLLTFSFNKKVVFFYIFVIVSRCCKNPQV